MRILLSFLALTILWTSCADDDVMIEMPNEPGDLSAIEYNPTPYELPQPVGFPAMTIPADNPMTQEGFELGRRLFYDVRLSSDDSKSCASCHLPELGFADGQAFSQGVEGEFTARSSMSLVNIGYNEFGLFWDGRVQTLEEQALLPVPDAIELINTWENVENMMRADEQYPTMFRKAFGIDDSAEIDSILATKAIAQFERALISHNSKYDKILQNDFSVEFTDAEQRGFDMFFDLGNEPGGSGVPDAECFHCHGTPLTTTGQFFNNGLDRFPTLADYEDKGFGAVTGDTIHNGQFKAVTLRNIELTAPYMHDGRFQTLEEVIDHYSEGVKFASNLDVNLREPLHLTDSEKADLVAFLKTLTDEEFTADPRFQNPF